jgi:DNA-binding response OmpR family regulator
MTHKILVIEDNENLAFGLQNNLEIEGYEVEVATDGATGLSLHSAATSLIILDLMLPDMDGFRILRQIRGDGSTVPILILTARGDEADRVRGLKHGADDYVTKPFSVLELLARVEALLRRTDLANASAAEVVRFGSIEVDLARHTVTRVGHEVALTPKEFDLLATLLRHQESAVSRDDLMSEVWGYPSEVLSRTVDTHIAELRRKLEANPAQPEHILTVRKLGYRLRL